MKIESRFYINSHKGGDTILLTCDLVASSTGVAGHEILVLRRAIVKNITDKCADQIKMALEMAPPPGDDELHAARAVALRELEAENALLRKELEYLATHRHPSDLV